MHCSAQSWRLGTWLFLSLQLKEHGVLAATSKKMTGTRCLPTLQFPTQPRSLSSTPTPYLHAVQRVHVLWHCAACNPCHIPGFLKMYAKFDTENWKYVIEFVTSGVSLCYVINISLVADKFYTYIWFSYLWFGIEQYKYVDNRCWFFIYDRIAICISWVGSLYRLCCMDSVFDPQSAINHITFPFA